MQRVDQAQYIISAFSVALAVLGTQACLPDFDVGSGGAGGSGAGPQCEPMSELACYSGIVGTDGLGMCTLGAQVCDPESAEYGPCTGSGSPTLESCSSPEDENCDGKPGCSGDCMWTRRFEKVDINNGYIHRAGLGGVVVDELWNTVIVGGYTGSADATPGVALDLGGGALSCDSHCGFVAKFDPTGKHLWSKSLDDHAGEAVALLSNGDMVVVARGRSSKVATVCGLTGDDSPGFIVVMLDQNGDCKPGWGIRIPAKLVNRPSVAADTAGNVYVAFAAESGKVGSTPVGGQSVLMRLDSSGNIGALETFGGNSIVPVAVAVDPAGEDVYVLGDGTGEIEFDANDKLSLTYRDIFVAKYVPSTIGSANGPWGWSRAMGAQIGHGAYAGDLVVTPTGKVFVAGTYGTPIDPGYPCKQLSPEAGGLMVVQLRTDTGTCLDASAFGAPGISADETNQYLRFRHDPDYKHFVLSGPYQDADLLKKDNGDPGLPVPVNEDIFVAKLDDKLVPTWVRGFGAQHKDLVYGLAVDSGGSIRLAGVGRGVDFGCGAAGADDGNFFVTRLSP